MLSGFEKPDEGEVLLPEKESLSYKPQYISIEYEGTVEDILKKVAGDDFETDYFKSEILIPLRLDKLLDRKVDEVIKSSDLKYVSIIQEKYIEAVKRLKVEGIDIYENFEECINDAIKEAEGEKQS